MNEKKAKHERKVEKQEMTPEQAKLILSKARQKDMQSSVDILNEALGKIKKLRCGIIATITIVQGASSIAVKAVHPNLKIDIIPLMEQ